MTEAHLEYHLSFSDPAAHLAEVSLTVHADGPGPLTFWMPVWTPGSYMVREFSRQVQDLAAHAGDTALAVEKIAKNRWQVTAEAAGPVTVNYRVYCREMSVRTSWVESDYAFISPAGTFLALEGAETRAARLTVAVPDAWAGVWCGLAPESEPPADAQTDRKWTFAVPDFDMLVDTPLYLGNPGVYEFAVDDVSFLLVNEGESGLWDGEKAAADVAKIVEGYRDMYGSLPLDRYVFLNLITEAGGGLEHKTSSVLASSRYAFRNREKYVDWLGLVSHEFFHVWNVKRSRPVALGPFDYEREVYTKSLWVAEGLTAYYTDLMPRRVEASTTEEYFAEFTKVIERLQMTPGRRLQSLEESSFDAWIKLYRQDENTANTTISYYTKGAVVGWLLDVEVRRATEGTKSLDDVMRALFAQYAGDRGYSDADMQEVVEKVAETSMQTFFDRYVRGRDELEYDGVLEYLGLRFAEPEKAKPWLGFDHQNETGRLRIMRTIEGGPARAAGVQAGDELLALDGNRVTPETLEAVLNQYRPGDRVQVTLARRDRLREAPLEVGANPTGSWKLELDPDASPTTVNARNAWLTQVPAGT